MNDTTSRLYSTGKQEGDECDYLFCAQSLERYVFYYLLPSSLKSPYLLQKKDTNGHEVRLFVELHPLIKEPAIRRFLISAPDRTAGIIGIWHHGVAEFFYGQNMQDQVLLRSLRHRNDQVIEEGLSWLCMHLLSWSQP